MKLVKASVVFLILVLIVSNVLLLLSNKSKDKTVLLYQDEVVKIPSYQLEDSLRKQAFKLTINSQHFLAKKDDSIVTTMEGKRLAIFVPQEACGFCLEKLFNKYWKKLLRNVAENIVVYYENSNINNIYYLGENLVDHFQVTDKSKGEKNLISIYFLNEKQEILDLYLFDVNSLGEIEPYFKSFLSLKK